MRNNLEDVRTYNPRQWGGKWASVTQTLTTAYVVNSKGPISLFLDANGLPRIVSLPPHDEGKFYCISHVGTTGALNLQDSIGGAVATLLPGDSIFVESTGARWVSIGGVATAVRYDQAQGLSSGQQQTARDNIGFDGASAAVIAAMAVRYDAAQALSAAQKQVARINIGAGPEIALEQYGCVGDGVTDDTTNFQAAIDAAELLDGATIVGKPGGVYKTSGHLIVGGNGVTVDLRGGRIKMTGSALFYGLLINGTATALSSTTTQSEIIGANSVTLASVTNFTIGDSLVVGSNRPVITNIVGNVVTFAPVLTVAVTNGQTITRYPKPTSAVAIHTDMLTLSSTTGFAVGDYLYIRELITGPPAYAWDVIVKITAINGLVVTVDTQLPMSLEVANIQTIYKIGPRERCCFRNAVVDMRESTHGASMGIYYANVAKCTLENIQIWGNNNGIGLNSVIGRDNTYRNIRVQQAGGGSGQDQDIQFTSETAAHISNVRSVESRGFGPTIALNSYTQVHDFHCYNPAYRGFKLQQSLGCTLNGVYVVGAGTTGFGLVVGSHRNMVSNVTSKHAGRRSGPYTVTMPIASPGVVTFVGNHLVNLARVRFTTTGTLPTGVTAGTLYYVRNVSGNTFNLSLTSGGALIDFTGVSTGTHSIWEYGYEYGIWIDESSDNLFVNMNSQSNYLWDLLEEQCTGNIFRNVRVTDTTKISLDAGVIEGLNGMAGPFWAAGPGFGREYFSNIAAGSAVALATGTVANVTSLALPAGHFDVSGTVFTNPNAATTSTALLAAISETSATMPTAPGNGAYARQSVTYTTGAPQGMPVGIRRMVFTVPTTIYLVVQSNFAVNTNAAYGYLSARRIS